MQLFDNGMHHVGCIGICMIDLAIWFSVEDPTIIVVIVFAFTSQNLHWEDICFKHLS